MVEGMAARGYDREFAERCFRQIEGFGEYGFPESHAASFALIVYASCWMKCVYPDVFLAAMLNSQPLGFYAPSQLVRDAREHGVEVREVDVNFSDWDFTLEDASQAPPLNPPRRRGGDSESVARLPLPACGEGAGGGGVKRPIHPRHAEQAEHILSVHAVRLGLRQILGVKAEEMRKLVEARGQGYDSVRDLWLRGGLTLAALEKLADADAFRSLGLDRREALWARRPALRRA